jgi:hypothetical protein
MKITVDDIEIEECLEPQGSCYTIKQGTNKILVDNDYQMKEIAKAMKFLSTWE